jgi:hypothetical protein
MHGEHNTQFTVRIGDVQAKIRTGNIPSTIPKHCNLTEPGGCDKADWTYVVSAGSNGGLLLT